METVTVTILNNILYSRLLTKRQTNGSMKILLNHERVEWTMRWQRKKRKEINPWIALRSKASYKGIERNLVA